jgi:hypothetical protein
MACATSESLSGSDRCGRQALVGPTPLAGAGLWLHTVEHDGNTAPRPKRCGPSRLWCAPASAGSIFDGVERALTYEELRTVSPYDAQVAALRIAIPEARDQIGTNTPRAEGV